LFSWELACEGTSLQGADLIIAETSGVELELTALELETRETPE
jgi:hypothetical protein